MIVAAHGLRCGDSPEKAHRSARMLQAYELQFWDTLAAAL